MFRHAPLLVEYLSSEAEEAEIDLVQARKCCDFKRMIIEEVPDQSIIGIPIPIGYESAQVSDVTVVACSVVVARIIRDY